MRLVHGASQLSALLEEAREIGEGRPIAAERLDRAINRRLRLTHGQRLALRVRIEGSRRVTHAPSPSWRAAARRSSRQCNAFLTTHP